MDDAELRAQLECAHVAAFGWALTCCRGHREDAEEVLHDVYINVLEQRARFSGQSAFRTWLFGVIRVTARSYRRRAWVRGLLLTRNAERVAPVSGENAHDAAERESLASRLRSMLATLPARQREVLHLVFYENLTVEGAAAVMHVSTGSARTHYARGKLRLAHLLGTREDL